MLAPAPLVFVLRHRDQNRREDVAIVRIEQLSHTGRRIRQGLMLIRKPLL